MIKTDPDAVNSSVPVNPVWLDLRTQSTVERLIDRTPGRNKNHLKVRGEHLAEVKQDVFLLRRLWSLQDKTGLPISTYFSAVKLRWLLDNVDEVREAVLSKRAMFGTVDTWIIWVRVVRDLQL